MGNGKRQEYDVRDCHDCPEFDPNNFQQVNDLKQEVLNKIKSVPEQCLNSGEKKSIVDMIIHYTTVCENIANEAMAKEKKSLEHGEEAVFKKIQDILHENLSGVVNSNDLSRVIQKLIDSSHLEIIRTNSENFEKVVRSEKEIKVFKREIRRIRFLVRLLLIAVLLMSLLCCAFVYYNRLCMSNMQKLTHNMTIGSEIGKLIATAIKHAH